MTRACRLLCLHDTQNLPDVDIYFTSDTRIAEILNLGRGILENIKADANDWLQ